MSARSYRSSSSDVYVRGYFRSNGTYVRPYYRSTPDGIIWNNYSCIDNGRCGTSSSYTSSNYYVAPFSYTTYSYTPSLTTSETTRSDELFILAIWK